ncbi:hypothetical protein KDAU_30870 [Dictyobacter aurantiacus]|uniref:Uncharacterized protein n=2 Tax=Dictyobacter aurantiacus TaxID=1936993 RepID=A0A401ZGE1_9CHLR|nr:hypothetical protein KDAU_30870 [Dictyobacter aurantiacus]
MHPTELTDLAALYASVFVHCWDSYAVQQSDGSYRRVHEPLSLQHLEAHLAGYVTLGTYLLTPDNTCSFAVFDDDQPGGLVRLAQLAAELEQHEGVRTLLEMSRRAGHLWVHLVEPTAADRVRAWLVPYALQLGCELYPKQDQLRSGPGSLIRLPLGIHRQTGRWYPFLTSDPATGQLVPVATTQQDCCQWVAHSLSRAAVSAHVHLQPAHPEPVMTPVEPVLVPPGRGAIRAWCQSQDIRQVIGRYVSLDHRGLGSCPFQGHHRHGDRRPSFQVFGGHDPHWYCYTWRRAGNLFDFFCEYYGLSVHEAWQRLQEGRLE